jgi:hypothetical protein
MSFNDIALFFNCDVDDEVDEMISCVANLNINESHEENFFGGNEYTFKRIK